MTEPGISFIIVLSKGNWKSSVISNFTGSLRISRYRRADLWFSWARACKFSVFHYLSEIGWNSGVKLFWIKSFILS